MMKKASFLINFFIIFNISFGQTQIDSCEYIFQKDSLTTLPEYGKNNEEWSNFVIKKIAPIITNCDESSEKGKISYYKLTISNIGKVINVDFIYFNYPDSCKQDILKEFINMEYWIPASRDGVNVCSYYLIPIIIKWDP